MSDEKINPFQAPLVEIPIRPNLIDTELKPKNWLIVAVKWTVICIVAAAPSFVVAMSMTAQQAPVSAAAGMLVAISLFIWAYTSAEMSPFFRRQMLDRRKKVAARITYGLRVGISIVFPIGLYLDFILGMISVMTMSALLGQGGFGFAEEQNGSPLAVAAWHFATTILDGLIMNVIVFVLMLIIYGICVLTMQRLDYADHRDGYED